jgi:hypothetical protein
MNHGPDPTPTPEPEGGRPSPNAEAARRRRQLREVEAERDQLRERLDATHRALVEQQAADLFADPPTSGTRRRSRSSVVRTG